MTSSRILLFTAVAAVACSPPLMRAAFEGDTSRVRALLQQGEDVNQTDRGWTPLLVAVHQSRIETARLLIEKGADVQARGP